MAEFLDDKGRAWQVRLDHSLLLAIRKRLGVDLHHMDKQAETLARIADGDGALLVNILYLACAEQCAQQGMTDEDFGRGFAEGETYQRGCLALSEAILLFTTPQRREVVTKLMRATLGEREAAERMMAEVVTKAIREVETSVTVGA